MATDVANAFENVAMESFQGAAENTENSKDEARSPPLLLVIVGEPFSVQQKNLIAEHIATELSAWDETSSGCNLSNVLNSFIAGQLQPSTESANGEKEIELKTECIRIKVLINPRVRTALEQIRSFICADSSYRYLLHSGPTFQSSGSGSWLLRDGTIPLSAVRDLFHANQCGGDGPVDFSTAEQGDLLAKYVPNSRGRVNSAKNADDTNETFRRFADLILSPYNPRPVADLLESSEMIGAVHFSRPTLYIFSGGEGPSAMLGIRGFTVLVDCGYDRRPAFWNFVRHFESIDTLLVTHVSPGNILGLRSFAERKSLGDIFPKLHTVFFNAGEAGKSDGCTSATGSPLSLSISDEVSSTVEFLHQIGVHLHPCVAGPNVHPTPLFHNIGYGSLDMYILSPTTDSQKIGAKSSKGNSAHLAADPQQSVCAVIVFRPKSGRDAPTRVFFGGAAQQGKIFEGLDRLKAVTMFQTATGLERTAEKSAVQHKPADSGAAEHPPKPSGMRAPSATGDGKDPKRSEAHRKEAGASKFAPGDSTFTHTARIETKDKGQHLSADTTARDKTAKAPSAERKKAAANEPKDVSGKPTTDGKRVASSREQKDGKATSASPTKEHRKLEHQEAKLVAAVPCSPRVPAPAKPTAAATHKPTPSVAKQQPVKKPEDGGKKGSAPQKHDAPSHEVKKKLIPKSTNGKVTRPPVESTSTASSALVAVAAVETVPQPEIDDLEIPQLVDVAAELPAAAEEPVDKVRDEELECVVTSSDAEKALEILPENDGETAPAVDETHVLASAEQAALSSNQDLDINAEGEGSTDAVRMEELPSELAENLSQPEAEPVAVVEIPQGNFEQQEIVEEQVVARAEASVDFGAPSGVEREVSQEAVSAETVPVPESIESTVVVSSDLEMENEKENAENIPPRDELELQETSEILATRIPAEVVIPDVSQSAAADTEVAAEVPTVVSVADVEDEEILPSDGAEKETISAPCVADGGEITTAEAEVEKVEIVECETSREADVVLNTEITDVVPDISADIEPTSSENHSAEAEREMDVPTQSTEPIVDAVPDAPSEADPTILAEPPVEADQAMEIPTQQSEVTNESETSDKLPEADLVAEPGAAEEERKTKEVRNEEDEEKEVDATEIAQAEPVAAGAEQPEEAVVADQVDREKDATDSTVNSGQESGTALTEELPMTVEGDSAVPASQEMPTPAEENQEQLSTTEESSMVVHDVPEPSPPEGDPSEVRDPILEKHEFEEHPEYSGDGNNIQSHDAVDAEFAAEVAAVPDPIRNDDMAPTFNVQNEWGQPEGLPAPTPVEKDKKQPPGKPASSGFKAPAPKGSKIAKAVDDLNSSEIGASAAKMDVGKRPRLSLQAGELKALGAREHTTKADLVAGKKTTAVRKPIVPFYVDLAYIPVQTESLEAGVDGEFFQRIRARYYVVPGADADPKILELIADAKPSWDDGPAEVSIIPTGDATAMFAWYSAHREQLTTKGITLAPSAAQCTVEMQGSSCVACRLEL